MSRTRLLWLTLSVSVSCDPFCGVVAGEGEAMTDEAKKNVSVWVGLRRCGCCVAVAVDDGSRPKDVASNKRDFLDDGLSVVHATWQEWEEKYRPLMLSCSHAHADDE